jgi:D-glycerate 3-kinase
MKDVNWSASTQQLTQQLVKQLSLPDSFQAVVRDIYLPLTRLILERKQAQPLLVSINGAQGTGKSTLTTFLKQLIESGFDYRVAAFSLDDFYLTRYEREQLAQHIHPLLITRGVPGTHDLNLMEQVILALQDRQPCVVPGFNKAIDDRTDESGWTVYRKPVDIILFEGWCNNSPVQTAGDLATPINALEEKEDPEGVWRDYVNEKLKEYHQRVFDLTDMCIMLKAPDFEHIYEWRLLQEQKLRDSLPANQHNRLMDEIRLRRFIQHYERISRHTLRYLPDLADVVIPIAPDHSIQGIVQNHG